MQRLAAGLLCLSVLGGCGGKAPRQYPVPESRRLDTDLDHAREATARVLADRGYTIQRNDPATGVIETDWLTVNPDYSANLFLTENEDRYSDCGKPGLWKTDHGKQARLAVSVSAAGRGQTELQVRAAFRTERTVVLLQIATLPGCRSRGRLEEEIFVETQVWALTNHLQRLRRGWQ
jgi:NlpB/DapX lipoprotein